MNVFCPGGYRIYDSTYDIDFTKIDDDHTELYIHLKRPLLTHKENQFQWFKSDKISRCLIHKQEIPFEDKDYTKQELINLAKPLIYSKAKYIVKNIKPNEGFVDDIDYYFNEACLNVYNESKDKYSNIDIIMFYSAVITLYSKSLLLDIFPSEEMINKYVTKIFDGVFLGRYDDEALSDRKALINNIKNENLNLIAQKLMGPVLSKIAFEHAKVTGTIVLGILAFTPLFFISAGAVTYKIIKDCKYKKQFKDIPKWAKRYYGKNYSLDEYKTFSRIILYSGALTDESILREYGLISLYCD